MIGTSLRKACSHHGNQHLRHGYWRRRRSSDGRRRWRWRWPRRWRCEGLQRCQQLGWTNGCGGHEAGSIHVSRRPCPLLCLPFAHVAPWFGVRCDTLGVNPLTLSGRLVKLTHSRAAGMTATTTTAAETLCELTERLDARVPLKFDEGVPAEPHKDHVGRVRRRATVEEHELDATGWGVGGGESA